MLIERYGEFEGRWLFNSSLEDPLNHPDGQTGATGEAYWDA